MNIDELKLKVESMEKEALLYYRTLSFKRNAQKNENNNTSSYDIMIRKALTKYRAYALCKFYIKEASTNEDLDRVIKGINSNINRLNLNIKELERKAKKALDQKAIMAEIKYKELEIKFCSDIITLINEYLNKESEMKLK